MDVRINDVLEMKKNHPCGGNTFVILRVGSEVRVICETCGRDMTLDRVKLEKAIKQILSSQQQSMMEQQHTFLKVKTAQAKQITKVELFF